MVQEGQGPHVEEEEEGVIRDEFFKMLGGNSGGVTILFSKHFKTFSYD